MAAFGAERKLLFEVNCFRFCPFCDIRGIEPDQAVEQQPVIRTGAGLSRRRLAVAAAVL